MVDSLLEAPEPAAAVAETGIPASVPGAPESTAAPVAGDEPSVTDQAASGSTRPRGPDGRFIKADGTRASDAEQAAFEKEAALPTSPPAAATPSAPPATAVSTPEPFVFRGAGQKIPIPGSSVSAEGHVTIPVEQVPTIRQLLSEGVEYRQTWRGKEADYKRQISEAGAVQEARAEKYNSAGLLYHERLHNPEWVQAFMADPERELAYLDRDVGHLLRSADLEAPKVQAPPTQDPAVEQQRLEAGAKATLAEYVEELLESPHAKAIYPTEAERKDVLERYTRRLAAYFVDRGEADGGIALHENAVDVDFQDDLKLRQASKQAALDAQKAHDFNKARNAPAVTAPPVVSTKGPSSTGVSTGRTYKDRDEWRKAQGLH